ncbi:MAG: RNA methyltransferase [Bacteroidota bacterium]
MKSELIEFFSEFVTETRYNLFLDRVRYRTRYLTVVLEDIYQPHNASAVLRTCDCFGIQDVHIIENNNKYRINPDVALGSNQWLSLKRYNSAEFNTPECIQMLKENGYRIVATTPHSNDINLENFDLSSGKAALFFGTELNGLTDEMINLADEFIKIPMVGFTESFNISVTVAIITHYLTHVLRSSESINWQLSQSEEQDILLDWLRASIKKSDLLEKKFIEVFNQK